MLLRRDADAERELGGFGGEAADEQRRWRGRSPSRLLLRAQLGATDPQGAVAALEALVADAQEVVHIIATVKQLLRSVQTDHQAFDLHEVIASTLLQIQWQMNQYNVAAVKTPRGLSKDMLGWQARDSY